MLRFTSKLPKGTLIPLTNHPLQINPPPPSPTSIDSPPTWVGFRGRSYMYSKRHSIVWQLRFAKFKSRLHTWGKHMGLLGHITAEAYALVWMKLVVSIWFHGCYRLTDNDLKLQIEEPYLTCHLPSQDLALPRQTLPVFPPSEGLLDGWVTASYQLTF